MNDCLAGSPEHIVCKQYQVAMVRKRATMDGIASCLGKAGSIEQIFLGVAASKKNYVFESGPSVQASAHYALGIFYRLIPDSFILSWLYDVRGSIDKSIHHHRRALAIDPRGACKTLMLAASLMCKEDNVKSAEYEEPQSLLSESLASAEEGHEAKACKGCASRILAEPSIACGFELTKQQTTDAEQIAHEASTRSRP